jgi:hypothetical protein
MVRVAGGRGWVTRLLAGRVGAVLAVFTVIVGTPLWVQSRPASAATGTTTGTTVSVVPSLAPNVFIADTANDRVVEVPAGGPQGHPGGRRSAATARP